MIFLQILFLIGSIISVLGTIDLVKVFQNVRPFGLIDRNPFNEETYSKNTANFIISLQSYGRIVVGQYPINTHNDLTSQQIMYEALIELLNIGGGQFEFDLRRECNNQFSAIDSLTSASTPEKIHLAVFDNFLLHPAVIDTIIHLLNQKVIYSTIDLKLYQDSPLVDRISALDFLEIQKQRQFLYGKEPIQPKEIKKAIITKRKNAINLKNHHEIWAIRVPVYSIIVICAHFTDIRDCKIHEELVFNDKYDGIVSKKDLTADELISFWYELFKCIWEKIEGIMDNFDITKKIEFLMKDTNPVGSLNKHRLRNLLIRQFKYNKTFIKQSVVYEAFNFKPSTWIKVPMIQKKLNNLIALGNPYNPLEIIEAILISAQRRNIGVGIKDVIQLRNSLIGEESVFVKIAERTLSRSSHDSLTIAK